MFQKIIFSTPLTYEEIQPLIDDLKDRRDRQLDIPDAGKNFTLKHLGMSVDSYTKNIMVGTDDKRIYPLLSRFCKTKKREFQLKGLKIIDSGSISVNKLITDLELNLNLLKYIS
jgi:hypothetical protein